MATSAVAPAVETGSSTTQAYETVCKKLKELSSLQGISSLVVWDEMVMMPSGSASSRGTQKAVLEGVLYDKRTDKELGELLESLWSQKEQLDEVAAAVVRDARKEFIRATAIPKELAQRLAELESTAHVAWVEARKASDFSKFAPFLKEMVEIQKEKARLINPSLPPYDVLLDTYEKGLTSARIDEIFTEVREGLVPLLKELKEKGTAPEYDWVKGDWDVTKQAELCKQVALDMGFDTETGRLDVSVHPFTIGMHHSDVRITTRFKKDDLTEGITGAVHEAGHALYEQGLNPEWEGLPVSSAMSMGIHESQSLFWERMVALGLPFSRYLLAKTRAAFPDFPDKTPEDLYGALNVIKEPSLIRVEADEVTYPLHIILRYEIEKSLIEGTLQVEDVPRVWGEKMEHYLGVKPPSDAQGCLQDVHWSGGAFGYFPTYSLGAMYACQLYKSASKDIPDVEKKISEGEFKALKEWLNEKIHRKGSLYPNGDELMISATGSPLQPAVFLDYLRQKYLPLYKLQ